MINELVAVPNTNLILFKELINFPISYRDDYFQPNKFQTPLIVKEKQLPEILFITSYPPRECGIATYSNDLIKALKNKFGNSFSLKVCALETENEKHDYADEVKYSIETADENAYRKLSETINNNHQIEIVLIQHEFGFFRKQEKAFTLFLHAITKPVVMVFHTVLPHPNEALKANIKKMIEACKSVIVMTNNSAKILMNDYGVPSSQINVIPHGTHLVPHLDKTFLKEKYNVAGRNVFSTFGLLSAGKSIETTLESMPEIIKLNPDVLFLVIGKTHPNVIKEEGEKYRNMLTKKVEELQLQNHVRFINRYLPLPDLLEYLQLTDIYLFTSIDRNQAVSGTFSYAISSGCPIISTPIPHASEVLGNDSGILVDFENAQQLSAAVNNLLSDETLRGKMSTNGLQKIVSTAWENSAVAHAILFDSISENKITLKFKKPEINLNHIKKLTTDFGMIQFSKINSPDIESGYTLDDNARALIAMCMHYELTNEEDDLNYIRIYFEFIKQCLQTENHFLNYVDDKKQFTDQNNKTNLADANGRAIWALGFLISKSDLMPAELIAEAEEIMQRSFSVIHNIHSTRAMSFIIKGLYYYNTQAKLNEVSFLIQTLTNRLVQMFKHESEPKWIWFESYLTYANSILPEALLCAWLDTGETKYKDIAKTTFDFLLSIIFSEDKIKVVSNQGWHLKGKTSNKFGEQPIDVAYTILALSKFYDAFKDEEYLSKMEIAFNWFLGNNHLHQIIYNPCTGGCYDGLEENHVNLNQGAESTVSYLLSRLTVEKYFNQQQYKKQNQKILTELNV